MDKNFFATAVALAKKAGVNVNDPNALGLFLKDTVGTRPGHGWLYENGPFSLLEDEPISAVIMGGSPLMNWIPSRLVDWRYPTVSHLEFVAPNGFDGSQTYRDYLRSVTIDDCDYGPSAVWSGFEYQLEGGEWSFTSPTLKEKDFGMRDFEQSPIYRVRGSQAGLPLTDDAEWAAARALFVMEQHMNYLLVYGDRMNSVMEYDGLDTVITPGYVQSHLVGPGTPHWANPLVVNAAATSTPADILDLIRAVVRKLRQRIIARNWTLAEGDMVVTMPAGMWPYIADAAAAGGNVGFTSYGFDGAMTFRDFTEERARITSGGLGFGFIDVDGQPIPVVADGNLGNNVTLDPGGPNEAPGIAGDIMVLTRRVNGLTLLEQQYIDWNRMNYPTNGTEDKFVVMNGLMKGGWKIENNACFEYYLKAGGRLVTYFQPLQARINNVVVETLMDNENESGAFWSQDFYAYDGQRGGAGAVLLNPL